MNEVEGVVEGATVYMDGRKNDGFGERCAVFGWAFAVVMDGELIGLACGVPPPHVASSPATEAWALAMAVEPGDASSATLYTDCKFVRGLARSGGGAVLAAQEKARHRCSALARPDGVSLRRSSGCRHSAARSTFAWRSSVDEHVREAAQQARRWAGMAGHRTGREASAAWRP